MKSVSKSIFIFLLCTFTCAAAPHYKIIIDANNEVSVLHLFQYDFDEKRNILVKEIFTEQATPSLSTLSTQPNLAGVSLQKLLNDVSSHLTQLNISDNEVKIDVLGTTGMRLLPVNAQQSIYENVRNYIADNYKFKINLVETLSGKMQGIYEWLETNYLEDKLRDINDTYGIIHIDDEALQITFATHEIISPDDSITFNYHDQTFTIFTKNVFGLGIEQSLLSMMHSPKRLNCFPSGYSNDDKEQYNFIECNNIYSSIVAHYNLNKQIPSFKDVNFLIIGEVYPVYEFFSVEDATQEALETGMSYVCTMSWQDMKNEYKDSTISEDKLSKYCAYGSLFDNVFYNALHLNYTKMSVTSQNREHHKMDWPLGSLVYSQSL